MAIPDHCQDLASKARRVDLEELSALPPPEMPLPGRNPEDSVLIFNLRGHDFLLPLSSHSKMSGFLMHEALNAPFFACRPNSSRSIDKNRLDSEIT